MSDTMDMTVFLADPKSDVSVPRRKGIEVVRRAEHVDVETLANLFVVTAASILGSVASVVHEANRSRHLRALFVRSDVELPWLMAAMADADLRALRNIIVHSGAELPERVLKAWSLNAPKELIADARLEGRDLVIRDCTLRQFRVSASDLPALSGMTADELGQFEVSESGSYLHWPREDIHLGLDSIRYAIDQEFREAEDARRVAYSAEFGTAVANVRKAHGLRQDQIEGLSERQVGRIERGESGVPRSDTLGKLAEAHGLAVGQYLEKVALAIDLLRSGAPTKRPSTRGHRA